MQTDDEKDDPLADDESNDEDSEEDEEECMDMVPLVPLASASHKRRNTTQNQDDNLLLPSCSSELDFNYTTLMQTWNRKEPVTVDPVVRREGVDVNLLWSPAQRGRQIPVLASLFSATTSWQQTRKTANWILPSWVTPSLNTGSEPVSVCWTRRMLLWRSQVASSK